MKQGIGHLLFLVLFLMTATGLNSAVASAEEVQESLLPRYVRDMTQQARFLQKQPAKSCRSDYKKLFEGNTVRVGIFFGYNDAEDIAFDYVLSRAFIVQLQQKCTGNLEVCGFKLQKTTPLSFELSKSITVDGQRKTVIVSVFYSAVSENNYDNLNSGKLFQQQEQHSAEVRAAFHQALSTSQVVFYTGHSRLGGGPGFAAAIGPRIFFQSFTKGPLNEFLGHLQNSGDRLQLLGFFACQTDKYFEKAVQSAKPGLGMIVTTDETAMNEGSETVLGALDSLLKRNCESEFNRAMVSENYPDHRATVIRHFFK